MAKPVSFADPARCSEIFDSDNREEWQNTSHILTTLNLAKDNTIADVGAGTGYFTNLFARQVTEGHVFAIDTEANMLGHMEKRFKNSGTGNITTGLCQHDNPCLPEGIDIVFLANVYRFIQNRPAYLANLFQQVTYTTKIVFVDFRGSHARVTPDQAMNEVLEAGFEVKAMDRSGCPDHYIMTFQKPTA